MIDNELSLKTAQLRYEIVRLSTDVVTRKFTFNNFKEFSHHLTAVNDFYTDLIFSEGPVAFEMVNDVSEKDIEDE